MSSARRKKTNTDDGAVKWLGVVARFEYEWVNLDQCYVVWSEESFELATFRSAEPSPSDLPLHSQAQTHPL